MEKYLRLLNPKSTNFDGVSGCSHGALTTADVCVAMSYAKLTQFQENLIRLKCLGANTIINVDMFGRVLLRKYSDQFNQSNVDLEYQVAIVRTALYEFCMVAGDYKPTERNREVLSGFSDSTVRKHLKNRINHVLCDLNEELELAQEKIFFQLNKSK